MTQTNHVGQGVLVVEDDNDIRDMLTMFLEGEGYSVHAVENGQEALNYLKDDGVPCLIFLDLMMPVMDGWEFCHQLRRDPSLSSVPVVILSAINNTKEHARALKAVDAIQKPVDFRRVYDVVKAYC